MNILALEPYYGGSHRAFLDGWVARSHHEWTLLVLPAYKWKWRMRHAPITFADEVHARLTDGQRWDLVFCSDMLSLATFRGLAPAAVRDLPAIVYFHENQLTYPQRYENERDYAFVVDNLTTALAAEAVWFNSAYHRDAFLTAVPLFLRRMPDNQPADVIDRIAAKSYIFPPGIDEFPPRGADMPGPLHVLWSARWEHDKNPELFFEALDIMKSRNVDFRLSVIGEQFRDSPEVFGSARERFHAHILRWGFQKERAGYTRALCESDVVVSTTAHEFFGIGVLEAVAAGCYPVLPPRLAYPEVFQSTPDSDTADFFYAGDARALADKLTELAERLRRYDLWCGDPDRGRRLAAKYAWKQLVPDMDAEVERLAGI
ncbi:MAG: DUF3524 domain-containing protein [Phycisphaerales bacterium]|nr:DUF3524 domain-containing protein [Phycisphaerales bacterium]